MTWFPVAFVGDDPFDPELAVRVDDLIAFERQESPVFSPRSFARVAAPGPGDDIGTLVVWADDVARWVSDSGDLDVWMVDDDIVHNWVC